MARPILSPTAWEVWFVRLKASFDLATAEKQYNGSSVLDGNGVNSGVEELSFRPVFCKQVNGHEPRCRPSAGPSPHVHTKKKEAIRGLDTYTPCLTTLLIASAHFC